MNTRIHLLITGIFLAAMVATGCASADVQRGYNDCCGKGFCGRCLCNRNEGEKPVYIVPKNNDINWCVGAKSTAYHCSTAIVLGVASRG